MRSRGGRKGQPASHLLWSPEKSLIFFQPAVSARHSLSLPITLSDDGNGSSNSCAHMIQVRQIEMDWIHHIHCNACLFPAARDPMCCCFSTIHKRATSVTPRDSCLAFYLSYMRADTCVQGTVVDIQMLQAQGHCSWDRDSVYACLAYVWKYVPSIWKYIYLKVSRTILEAP